MSLARSPRRVGLLKNIFFVLLCTKWRAGRGERGESNNKKLNGIRVHKKSPRT
jgi:hypothetical protein